MVRQVVFGAKGSTAYILESALAANRRRALIEHAHANRPLAPDYSGSSEFMGQREAVDGSLVDPALTHFVARRQVDSNRQFVIVGIPSSPKLVGQG